LSPVALWAAPLKMARISLPLTRIFENCANVVTELRCNLLANAMNVFDHRVIVGLWTDHRRAFLLVCKSPVSELSIPIALDELEGESSRLQCAYSSRSIDSLPDDGQRLRCEWRRLWPSLAGWHVQPVRQLTWQSQDQGEVLVCRAVIRVAPLTALGLRPRPHPRRTVKSPVRTHSVDSATIHASTTASLPLPHWDLVSVSSS
jgi:hypothetical protein